MLRAPKLNTLNGLQLGGFLQPFTASRSDRFLPEQEASEEDDEKAA